MSDDPRGLRHGSAATHPLVRLLLEDQLPDLLEDGRLEALLATDARPLLEIDPRDEMLAVSRQLCQGLRDAALVDYLRAGLTAARTLDVLLGWLRVQRRLPDRPLRVLDFASGWGRVTRFLTALDPDLEITVSDISAQAVAYQRETFGLGGFASASRSEDLEVPGEHLETGFDAVLVASLFTHLPETTFVPWLRRLFALVRPGGVLALSTHPEDRVPEGLVLPRSGLLFEAASEIPHLDVADYGRTWVSTDFAERAIDTATAPGHPRRRFRRCLWHLQDLWVIPRDRDAVLSGLDLDGGPDGRLEGISFEPAGGEGGGRGGAKLWLGGWAAHPLHPEPEVKVEAVVADGCGRRTVARVTPDRPRPDVARTLERPELAHSGWLLALPLGDPSGGDERPAMTDRLLVKAVDRRHRTHVLHLSTFEGLVTGQQSARLRNELAFCRRELQSADGHLKVNAVEIRDLKARLAAIEASRFWKLRNLWFRLTGRA